MEETIRQILARACKVEPSAVGPGASPATLPAWDSASHMRIVLELEDAFHLSFSDDEVMRMVSYSNILDTVRRLKGNVGGVA